MSNSKNKKSNHNNHEQITQNIEVNTEVLNKNDIVPEEIKSYVKVDNSNTNKNGKNNRNYRNKNKNNYNKPVNKPSETVNSKADNDKAEDNKVIENKAIENKVTDNKATNNKTADNKKADNKTVASNKSTNNKSTNNKKADNKTAANKTTNNKAESNKAVDNKTNDKKPVEKKPVEKKPVDKEPVDQKPTEKKPIDKKPVEKKAEDKKQETKENKKSNGKPEQKESIQLSPEHVKLVFVNAVKILLPVVACAIVIAILISYIGKPKSSTVELTAGADIVENSEVSSTVALSDEPLEENAYTDVNELMKDFYKALSDGDMDKVKSLRDYNDDTEIIQYEKRSEFIESYENVNCYTKPGLEDGSYFVYVSYDVKVANIDTMAPGLNAYYVYTMENGNLIIDGDMEDSITAAFKLVTSQDDVVDLYNEVDVNYKEAVASDEALNTFMAELPAQIKTSVGEALAQLENQNVEDGNTESEAETQASEVDTTETTSQEEQQNQVVNQIVRATDTVNVRSSDSEEADKIGRAAAGTEMQRIEDRINGWSKVIYEGKESFIKSEYLEVVSSEPVNEDTAANENTNTTATETTTATGSVVPLTNVNIRKSADQNSEKLGTAVAGTTYELLGIEGEWYKIKFNGNTGYGKAEYFLKQ